MSDWPVTLRGVTESIVTTLGPNERWNVAALGLHAPEADRPVSARTWGRTRTWRNFVERGEGYVQFTQDPIDFVDAALSVREERDPILESTDAWVHVEVERDESGESEGTQWVDWRLIPIESTVERRVVPTTNRGYYAVVEATVAASRLDVDAYDRDELVGRLEYFADVVDACGGPRDKEAFDHLREYTEW